MRELPKTYDPKSVEKKIYQMWLDGGWFKAERDPEKTPFTIVIPPPNVTGQLHLGHAFDDTIQDALIRYKRMKGFSALWLPGTDHAGIATQIKVEEKLREEGLTVRQQNTHAASDHGRLLRLVPPALYYGRAVRKGCA